MKLSAVAAFGFLSVTTAETRRQNRRSLEANCSPPSHPPPHGGQWVWVCPEPKPSNSPWDGDSWAGVNHDDGGYDDEIEDPEPNDVGQWVDDGYGYDEMIYDDGYGDDGMIYDDGDVDDAIPIDEGYGDDGNMIDDGHDDAIVADDGRTDDNMPDNGHDDADMTEDVNTNVPDGNWNDFAPSDSSVGDNDGNGENPIDISHEESTDGPEENEENAPEHQNSDKEDSRIENAYVEETSADRGTMTLSESVEEQNSLQQETKSVPVAAIAGGSAAAALVLLLGIVVARRRNRVEEFVDVDEEKDWISTNEDFVQHNGPATEDNIEIEFQDKEVRSHDDIESSGVDVDNRRSL